MTVIPKLNPEHLKFQPEPLQLHVKVRKTNGRCGGERVGERVGITYKVKRPGIDFSPCFQGAEHSLETVQVFFCINSGNYKHAHTHEKHTSTQTETGHGSSVFQTVRSPTED